MLFPFLLRFVLSIDLENTLKELFNDNRWKDLLNEINEELKNGKLIEQKDEVTAQPNKSEIIEPEMKDDSWHGDRKKCEEKKDTKKDETCSSKDGESQDITKKLFSLLSFDSLDKKTSGRKKDSSSNGEEKTAIDPSDKEDTGTDEGDNKKELEKKKEESTKAEKDEDKSNKPEDANKPETDNSIQEHEDVREYRTVKELEEEKLEKEKNEEETRNNGVDSTNTETKEDANEEQSSKDEQSSGKEAQKEVSDEKHTTLEINHTVNENDSSNKGLSDKLKDIIIAIQKMNKRTKAPQKILITFDPTTNKLTIRIMPVVQVNKEDMKLINGGIRVLNAFEQNKDILKSLFPKDMYGKIGNVLIYKNKHGEYEEYWGKIKFHMNNNDEYVDETGFLQGKLVDSVEDIVEKGKITDTGFFQSKDMSDEQLRESFHVMQVLISEIARIKNKRIVDVMSEEVRMTPLDRLIFEKNYKEKKTGPDGCVYVCECKNAACENGCEEIKCVDRTKLNDLYQQ